MTDINALRKEIDSHIRCFDDFPKKGVIFRDILPVFSKPSLVRSVCRHIADCYRGRVDAVAALESRGFLFGPIVALELEVPFVPIRKSGKLPGPICSASYVKEYGTDTLEAQKGVLSEGHRVLLLDDVLATGGTLSAAIQLIKEAKAIVQGIFVIVELGGLKGRNKLGEYSKTTESLLKYE